VQNDHDTSSNIRKLRVPSSAQTPGFEAIGETLPAKIHEILEEAIIRGELAPSSRLHADDIAAQYGVSRIPVREALRSLHEAGWVDIRPRYGVYVRERSMTEQRELFEARSGIEAQISRLAAERRTPDDLAAMREIVEVGRSAVKKGDLESTSRASVNFHDAVRAACGNRLLASLAASLEKRARFYFAMVEGNLGSDWIAVEELLLQAISDKDTQLASETSRNHILSTGQAVSQLLEEEQ
jgi:DNA-binding GntR family transcriptional regulator